LVFIGFYVVFIIDIIYFIIINNILILI